MTEKLNKSASRAIDIIELFARSNESLTLSIVSKQLNIPMSSAFDLVYTLVNKGILDIDNSDFKTFKLSMKLFELGTSIMKNLDFHKVARPLLENLSHEAKETVFLAIEDKGNVVYLDRVQTVSSISTNTDLGARNPMYSTGIGKALLASYSAEKIHRLFNDKILIKKTQNTITSLPALFKELDLIKSRGYSIDNQENEADIICVAAPIYNNQNVAIAAASISSIYVKMDTQRIEELGNAIRNTCLTISRKLGYLGASLYS